MKISVCSICIILVLFVYHIMVPRHDWLYCQICVDVNLDFNACHSYLCDVDRYLASIYIIIYIII